MTDRETYLAREAEARADADAAILDNVRDRCLRSAEAWGAMATRAERTEKMRATLQAHKAADLDNILETMSVAGEAARAPQG
jgi:hypothetical protein